MISQFWFHGLRNCFITVAECELLRPLSLTKRLVNHTRPSDVTEGYGADWSIDQLHEPAQRLPRPDRFANAIPQAARRNPSHHNRRHASASGRPQGATTINDGAAGWSARLLHKPKTNPNPWR